MSITLDDKATVRAYCIKEDFIIRENKVYQVKQKLQRLLSEGRLINLVPKATDVEIIEIIKDMVETARQLHGADVFNRGEHTLRILLTGGGGDFSPALIVKPPADNMF